MLIEKSLSEKLRIAMDSWLTEAKRSQNMLARMAGTSQSTVRRVLQGEVAPEEGTAQRLARIVMKLADFEDFMDEMSPQTKSRNVTSNFPKQAKLLGEALGKVENVKIITLATGSDGTDAEEVIRKFGEGYISHFDDLCNSGVLELRGKRWFVAENDVSDFSLELARTSLSAFISMGSRENDAIPGAAIAWGSCEAVTPKIASEIYSEILEFNTRIISKINSPESKGDILVVVGDIFNVIKGRECLG